MLKSLFGFYLSLFGILFPLEKFACFKNCILGANKVHLVLNILFRRRKLVLEFLDFYLYFSRIFLVGGMF